MLVKLTVAAWIRYLNEPWPKNQTVDDTVVKLGSKLLDQSHDCDVEFFATCDQDEIVTVSGGAVLNDGKHAGDLQDHVWDWLNRQSTETIVFEVPKEHADAALAALVPYSVRIVQRS